MARLGMAGHGSAGQGSARIKERGATSDAQQEAKQEYKS